MTSKGAPRRGRGVRNRSAEPVRAGADSPRPPEPRERQSREWLGAALAVAALALTLRLVHLWQMHGTPYFGVLMGDARAYDAWARDIAAGDWIGRDVFYQAPLYPYFIAIVYRLFGTDLLALRLSQAIVGTISCVLLAYAGARWFSRRVGLVAGLTLACYAPAIFFDGLVQKSALDVFFVCGALAILGALALPPNSNQPNTVASDSGTADSRAWRGPVRGALLVALGAVLGCLALTRENAIVLAPLVAVWAASRESTRPAALGAAVRVAAGLALVLLPVAARNYAVGGEVHLTTSQFGPNFYIGNHAGSDGTYAPLRFGRGSPEFEREDATALAERAVGRRLTPSEVSAYWTGRALDFIATEPLQWLGLEARKAALLVNATEMLDTESQEAHADYSWPLRLLGPVGHFGLLVPLAVAGLIVTWPQRTRLWLLYAVVGMYALSTIVFYVFARYRYPLVPLLILFASAGLVHAWQAWSIARRPRVLAAPAVGVVLAALVANWPLLSIDRMRAITDTNLGTALYEAGRYEEAIERYRKAISTQPDYAPAYNNLGVALRASGRVDEAIAAYEQGLRLRDDYPDLHFNLANALLATERANEAAEHLRRASAITGDSAAIHNNLGKALAEAGKLAEAVTELERAVALEPGSIQAHRNLGSVLASLGRSDEALRHLQHAVQLAPDDVEARYDLGRAWLERGRFAEAEHELAAAVAGRPDYVEGRNNLGIALASQGRLREAIAQWEEALRIQPDFADARQNLALARRALGE